MEDIKQCFCIGPQNGEPYCPCRMKNVIIKDGRYVEKERDLGPVKETIEDLIERYSKIEFD